MDFLQLRFLGPLKWREPHKSPKVVDFVQSAPFPEAISKAPVDFLDFRLLGPLKWREPQKSRETRKISNFLLFRVYFGLFLSGRSHQKPGIRPRKLPKSVEFDNCHEDCGPDTQNLRIFRGFRQHQSLSKRTNRLKRSAPRARTPGSSVQGLGYLP